MYLDGTSLLHSKAGYYVEAELKDLRPVPPGNDASEGRLRLYGHTAAWILMPLFKNLPQAILGAIVVKAMIRMLDFGYFRKLNTISKLELSFALTAFFGALILGVLPGVALGGGVVLAGFDLSG